MIRGKEIKCRLAFFVCVQYWICTNIKILYNYNFCFTYWAFRPFLYASINFVCIEPVLRIAKNMLFKHHAVKNFFIFNIELFNQIYNNICHISAA